MCPPTLRLRAISLVESETHRSPGSVQISSFQAEHDALDVESVMSLAVERRTFFRSSLQQTSARRPPQLIQTSRLGVLR